MSCDLTAKLCWIIFDTMKSAVTGYWNAWMCNVTSKLMHKGKTSRVILVYHRLNLLPQISLVLTFFFSWACTQNASTMYISVCHVIRNYTSLPVYNDQPNAPLFYVQYNMQTLARRQERVWFNLTTCVISSGPKLFMCAFVLVFVFLSAEPGVSYVCIHALSRVIGF